MRISLEPAIRAMIAAIAKERGVPPEEAVLIILREWGRSKGLLGDDEIPEQRE